VHRRCKTETQKKKKKQKKKKQRKKKNKKKSKGKNQKVLPKGQKKKKKKEKRKEDIEIRGRGRGRQAKGEKLHGSLSGLADNSAGRLFRELLQRLVSPSYAELAQSCRISALYGNRDRSSSLLSK